MSCRKKCRLLQTGIQVGIELILESLGCAALIQGQLIKECSTNNIARYLEPRHQITPSTSVLNNVAVLNQIYTPISRAFEITGAGSSPGCDQAKNQRHARCHFLQWPSRPILLIASSPSSEVCWHIGKSIILRFPLSTTGLLESKSGLDHWSVRTVKTAFVFLNPRRLTQQVRQY